MSPHLRFLPAGGDALLVETRSLDQALALLDQVQASLPQGVIELVPAARTVLLRFDPFLTTPAQLQAKIETLDLTPAAPRAGQEIEIPVYYDGEDLGDVAQMLGLSVKALIAKHEAALFKVAFTGFAPGFAYLSCSDPALHVPRRASPRLRIPAGAVALAGEFGGVYPSDSPGGWQILGRTPVAMWDLTRSRPALLAPGDRVRFRDIAKGAQVPGTQVPGTLRLATQPISDAAPATRCPVTQPAAAAASVTVATVMQPASVTLAAVAQPASDVASDDAQLAPHGPICITRADRPVLAQDLGRAGQAAQGVSRAGAMDRGSLIALNRILGNPRGTPALEIAFGGFALRSTQALTLAITGAECPVFIETADGRKTPAPHGAAFALNPGESLRLGTPKAGIYSYLGLRGGFAFDRVLGSASRDTLAKLGTAPLETGATLCPAYHPAQAVTQAATLADLPSCRDVVQLDVILGPRDDWFTAQGLTTLVSQDWLVSAESSRVGKRLAGAQPLERLITTELPSEATVAGSIQVPHSGQPVLFLADHPLTGGYPVIGVIAPHHLDLASQIPPGAKIRFHPISSPNQKG